MQHSTKVSRTALEKIKLYGQIRALKDFIQHEQHLLSQVWSSTMDNGRYTRLGEALEEAEGYCLCIREALKALQELQPENK